MLAATLLALAAAGLHAAWNLVAKRSIDRVTTLSAQFIVGGLIGGVVLAITRDLPAAAWWPALVTGVVHVPYLLLLALAYEHGDFSVAYPVARGTGAVLAGLGGVVLLDDDLGVVGAVAVLVVAAGMWLLSGGATGTQLATALAVGVTIGVYTVNDSRGVRTFGITYPFAAFVAIGVMMSIYVVATGRVPRFVATMRDRLAAGGDHRGGGGARLRAGDDRRPPGPSGIRRRPARIQRPDRRVPRQPLPRRRRNAPSDVGLRGHPRRPRPPGRGAVSITSRTSFWEPILTNSARSGAQNRRVAAAGRCSP